MRGITFFVLHPKRLLALVGGVLAGVAYVWYAAVRAVPAVRRRKTAAREAWQRRPPRAPSAS